MEAFTGATMKLRVRVGVAVASALAGWPPRRPLAFAGTSTYPCTYRPFMRTEQHTDTRSSAAFPRTRHSVLLAARDADPETRRRALDVLVAA